MKKEAFKKLVKAKKRGRPSKKETKNKHSKNYAKAYRGQGK